jgi:geranylgeranyl transferase type-1 subunit beta
MPVLFSKSAAASFPQAKMLSKSFITMELNFDAIATYFTSIVRGIPSTLQQMELELTTIAYFCINGLAMIGRLDSSLPAAEKSRIIDWVYSQQISAPGSGGFRSTTCSSTPSHRFDESHLSATYSALATLLLLGDDFSRVDTPRLMATLTALQAPSGSFRASPLNDENDVRFVFCAAAVSTMLGTFSSLDVEKSITYLLDCQTYEGGFGHRPGDEAHGGPTYCAIASLDLWHALDRIRDRRRLALWFSQRQSDGFNGRSHKGTDTCYSFWVGAPMTTLKWFDVIVDRERLLAFIFSNFCDGGQFRSQSQTPPDVLHTHFALSGLSLLGFPGIEKIDPSLGVVEKYLPERIRRAK